MEFDISQAENNSQVGISFNVIDNGIGMTEKDVKNLFTPFFKTEDETSLNLNLGGNGIGLNLCKRLAV